MTTARPSLCPFVSFTCWLILLATGGFLPAQERPRTGPFTAPPRSVRSRVIDQQHLALDFRFDLEKQRVEARATLTGALLAPTQKIVLDAVDLKVTSVDLLPQGAGQAVKLAHQTRKGELAITLPKEGAVGDKFRLLIAYSVERPKGGFHFVAPDASEPTQPRMVWTQSEPEYARYWFPCVDSPADRLTSEIFATAPKGLVTLSNGALVGKRDNADGTVTWHWSQAKSHVPYLLSVVVGDFEVLEQAWDGIPVQSYVPRGYLGDAPRSFEKTPRMMDFFSRKIGYRYPWPKYAQICVDEYNWGGMEHTSATTLNLGTLHDERAHLDVSSDNLVAHELAHQWWGDLLTCKDWGELWLNESFATYFATLWTEHDLGWDEAVWARHNEANDYLREDARYRRSIVNYRYNSPEQMFDGHSYPKGGRVLHMLRGELGEEAFWRGIQRYIQVNQHRTVETADLRIALEEATGQGLGWFFDQWLYHGGHPEFQVSWRWDEAAKQVQVVVKQTQTVDEITPLFRSSVEIELGGLDQPLSRKVTVSKKEETFHFDAPREPAYVCFDPHDWILKKLDFPQGKDELLAQLRSAKQLTPRFQAVQQLAPLVGDKDVAAALALVAKSDAFWGVREAAVKALAKGNGDAVRTALLAAAQSDEKSFVRRAALQALGSFAHDETRAALRKAVGEDRSYYAAAEALRALVKVDRQQVAADLLAALGRESHRDVLAKAACDGLAELKHAAAAESIDKLLAGSLTPQRRAVLIAGLARLKPQDDAILNRLHGELENERSAVRQSAVEALVEIAHPASVAVLQKHRDGETSPRTLRSLDEALEKIRAKLAGNASLVRELDQLREQNAALKSRLEKLEGSRDK